MNKRILTRLLVLCLVAAGSFYLIASQGLRLGLDLSGGVQIDLRVLTDDAIKADTDRTTEAIREELREQSGSPVEVAPIGLGELQIKPATSAMKALPGWTVEPSSEDGVSVNRLHMQASRAREIRENATLQTKRVLENRLNGLGVGEITIQRSGKADDYALHLQVPGVENPDRVKKIIQATALLELKLVERGPFESTEAALASYSGSLPQDFEVLHESDSARAGRQGAAAYYVVRRSAAVSGVELKNASVSQDRRGRPGVGFALTASGARRFAIITEENIGRGLAIVLDGVIQSVAEIHTRIAGDGIIEGGRNGFSPDQARDLALVLRSGALPARTDYIAEELVGPSLGSDSIRAGVAASGVAVGAVAVFMIAYYRMSGVNATFAMLLNLLLLMGMMASLHAALTVPGIAGIVLTIGVGIDSNVLVFERIREELAAGRSASAAVAAGFQRVFRTLIDTHLAAMISAVILFAFGTGAIRGFAVTLAMGLLSNLFTSVFVSRTLFEWVLRRRRPLSI